MKIKNILKRSGVLACLAGLGAGPLGISSASASAGAGLIISEFLANPSSSPDSPREFIELVATQDIDFSVTPYCVVFCSNGSAGEDGWIGGGQKNYGVYITGGTVHQNDVVFFGGAGMVGPRTEICQNKTGPAHSGAFLTAKKTTHRGRGREGG